MPPACRTACYSLVRRLRGSAATLLTALLVTALLPGLISPAALFAAHQAQGKRGMVVAVSPPAVEVGVEVLKEGGTAVDAAVAVALAMAVTWPEAGNIGGGGFMMVHPGPGQQPVCIDYRETAPAATHRDMFKLGETRFGSKIVGVPGTVAGLALAHEKYGKLPWKRLVMPAVKLAAEGFEVDASLARSLNSVLKSEASKNFPELLRVFGHPEGRRWKPGDRLVQPDLARTLTAIAERGPAGFYQGEVAEKLVAEMKAGNGLITLEDLAAYRAKVRSPIHGTFRGYDIYGPPPPSSGGICIVQMLNVLERFDLKSQGRFSAKTLHLMIEAMRRAYLDRARYLGDADFVDIPAHLTTKEYAARLAAGIDLTRATRSEDLASDLPLAGEGDSTTHFSVIDGNGMAVSNTYTLEYSFGSRVVVRGAGFLLNNEMGDFNWKAGHTDRRGNIGTQANLIAPGKRMLSSQTPVIVTRDGKVLLVTGSPGGRTIINTVLNVVLNVLEFEMPLNEAVAAPRLHHQWMPDLVRFEGAADPKYRDVLDTLRAMGHQVNPESVEQGDAHSIWIDPATGTFHGVADHRRGGAAAGF